MANRKVSNAKAARKALIVAIDDYPGSANDLPSCLEDAKAVTELLKTAPYEFQEIRTHTNADATIQNVTDSLKWLFGNDLQNGTQVNPDDRLVFYYSGHGFRTEQDGILRECLCLYDGFFFDRELSDRTQSLPPSVLTVILDSCHSGGMEKRFFNLLSSQDKAPNERVRIKTWIPDREEFAKAIAAEEEALPVKRFGASMQSPSIYTPKATSTGRAKASEMSLAMIGEAQVNGLLITACQAEQTASASSSQTDGKSAFTFCLLNAFKKLGSQLSGLDQLSSNHLFDTVAQELEALRFKQIPALIEPPNSPGLKSRSFITLQAIEQSSESAAPAASSSSDASASNQAPPLSNTTTQSSTSNQGDNSMYATQLPNSTASQMPTQVSANDEKFWGAIIGAAISAAPEVYRAIRGKEVQLGVPAMPTPQFPTAQPQPTLPPDMLNRIMQALQQQSQTPQPTQTVPGKGFQTGYSYETAAQPAPTDEKFWGPVIVGAISAIPSVIRAVRGKDYQPGDPEDEKVLRAVLPALLPGIAQSVASQNSQPGYSDVSTAQVPTLEDDKGWGSIIRTAIREGSRIARAYFDDDKGFQPGYSDPSLQMPMPTLEDDKGWGSIIRTAIREGSRIARAYFDDDKGFQSGASGMPTLQGTAAHSQSTIPPEVINQIMQALQQQSQTVPGKDFQTGYSYETAAQPAPTDEKFWGPVIVGAISAIPSVIRAVRGKDYQPGDPEDEKVLRAVLPTLLPGIAQSVREQYRPNGRPSTLPYPAPNPVLVR